MYIINKERYLLFIMHLATLIMYILNFSPQIYRMKILKQRGRCLKTIISNFNYI